MSDARKPVTLIDPSDLIGMTDLIPMYAERRDLPGRSAFMVAKAYDASNHMVILLGRANIALDIDGYNKTWRAWDGQYGPPTLAEMEAEPWSQA